MTKRITFFFCLFFLVMLAFTKASAQELTDSVILDLGRPVLFQRGAAVISPEDLIWIKDTLRHQLEDSDLLRLYVRAGASPEGQRANNERLSKNRFAAVNKFLSQYDIPADKVSVETITEDYPMLHALMKRANDKDLRALDSLVQKCGTNEAALKHELIVYQGGALWQRLYREYFPALRAVRLVLFRADAVERKISGEPAPSKPLPEQKPVVVEQPAVKPDSTVQEPVIQHEPELEHYVDSIIEDTCIMELREPMLSVKTNLLYDAAVMPKLGYSPIVNIWVEYYFRHSRWTLVGEYDFPWWSTDNKHHYFQMLNWTLEGRRFFRKDEVRQGWFLSAYVQGNYWDFSFNAEDAWQGEGGGLGIGGGWVKRLGKDSRWKIECFLKAGAYLAQYDPYHAGDPFKGRYYYDWSGGDVSLFKRRNHLFTWFGPTSVGVNISYDLLYRRASDGKVTWKKLFKSK